MRNSKGQYIKGFVRDGDEPLRTTDCPVCGKTIKQKRILRPQKHCSEKCVAISLQKRRNDQCKVCDKKISIKPYQEGRKKYCSKSCRDDARKIPGNINSGSFKKGRILPMEHRGLGGKAKKGKIYVSAENKKKRKKAYIIKNRAKINEVNSRWVKLNRTRSNAYKKKYMLKPGVKEKMAAYYRISKANDSKKLSDSYVKQAIVATKIGAGLSYNDITSEMIELKREQLTFHRLEKELKNGINSARD